MNNSPISKIAVLDFGGQYAHLIANRVRRLGIYSEVKPADIKAEKLKEYQGIIFSGGPQSVYDKESVKASAKILDLGIPILGICYGHQLITHLRKGKVKPGEVKEYGAATLKVKTKSPLLEGFKTEGQVWMSHFDEVITLPKGTNVIASTQDCKYAAVSDEKNKIYGVQFHPEVTHSKEGNKLLKNFLNICGLTKSSWSISKFVTQEIKRIGEQIGDKKVFMLISGGVDSSVAFTLLKKALESQKSNKKLEDRLFGLFIDTGLMRYEEKKEVQKMFKKGGIKGVHFEDSSKEFLSALKDIYDPEKKRRIIGQQFLEIQKKVVKKFKLNPEEWLLGQGTIYPDTIESGGSKHASKIKTHHNRVPEIEELIKKGLVIEPLQDLYKDEVRKVGRKLGLSSDLIDRHPFPGPGLGVRCLCCEGEDSTPRLASPVENIEEKINQFLAPHNLFGKILPVKSVGVQGDFRTYKHPLALFPLASSTKKENLISYKLLKTISPQVTNRFLDINRVVLHLNSFFENKKEDPKNISFKSINSFITPRRVSLLQKADKIVMDSLKAGFRNPAKASSSAQTLYKKIWQFPVVLLPIQNTAYSIPHTDSLVLRPVSSQEAMTAEFSVIPEDQLKKMYQKLSKLDLSAIFYDLTNKPPGTIEWE